MFLTRVVLPALGASFAIAMLCAGPAVSDEIADSLAVIAKVGQKGEGSAAAKAAREKLLQHDVEILPQLLQAMDTPNIVAANWYRSIFDDIVNRQFARQDPRWRIGELKSYVRDASHQGRSRRLVLSLVDRIEPGFRDQVLSGLLDDAEFRNDAVELAIRDADKLRDGKQTDAAKRRYREAFVHARESEQVLLAARKLTEVGDAVDPVQHLGFMTHWYLIGPFEAPGTSGFDAAFPPEKRVDLHATYAGKDQRTLKWTAHATADPLGQVNLIDALSGVREAVGFAYAEIRSPRDQAVQLRCSADDNLTVWLNQEKVLGQRQWLNGTRLDRFVTPVTLKGGTNRVLVKICQGPQHVNPEVPNNWTFQLRFCDATGANVGCAVELPTRSPDTKSE